MCVDDNMHFTETIICSYTDNSLLSKYKTR